MRNPRFLARKLKMGLLKAREGRGKFQKGKIWIKGSPKTKKNIYIAKALGSEL